MNFNIMNFTEREIDLLIEAAHMNKFRRYEGIITTPEKVRNFENDMDDLIHKLYEMRYK